MLMQNRKLETLLDSQIATTSNLTLLRQFVKRPTEKVWAYDRLEAPFTTELYKTMKDRFGDMSSLEGVFRFAWDASSELGKWCADRAWAHALAEDVLPKLEGNISKAIGTEASDRLPETAYQEISRIKEAHDTVKNHSFDRPDAPGSLSPKVRLLRQELGKHFESPTDTKCIVFTKMRYTARILFELFNELNMPYLRPGVLVGVRSSDPAGMNITFRQQFIALVKFRRGEINCLVRKLPKYLTWMCLLISLSLRPQWQKRALTFRIVTWWLGISHNFLSITLLNAYVIDKGSTYTTPSSSTYRAEVEQDILSRR